MAHDPVKVDPAHYKVEFENANVRVLRIKYGPRERSVVRLSTVLRLGLLLEVRRVRRALQGSTP